MIWLCSNNVHVLMFGSVSIATAILLLCFHEDGSIGVWQEKNRLTLDITVKNVFLKRNLGCD